MGGRLPRESVAECALEAVPDAFFVLDRDLRIEYLNRAALAFLGETPRERLGQVVWEARPEMVGSELENAFRQAADEQVPSSFDYHDAPTQRWFKVSVHPLPGGGLCANFHDITEERRTAEQLAKGKDLLAALAQGQLFGSFRWRIKEDRLEVSPEVFELFGLPQGPADTGLRFWYDQLDPEDALASEATLAKLFVRGRTSFACDIRTRVIVDGRRRWLQMLAHVTYDDAGRAVLLAGIVFDASDRKRLEEEAQESRERLRTTLESASVGVWTANPLTRQFTASGATMRILGLPPDTRFDERLVWSLVHPEERLDRERKLRDSFESGEPLLTEMRIVRPDGTIRWVHVSGRMVTNRQTGEREMAGILQDITERKMAEVQLQSLFDNMPGAVCIFDKSLRLLSVNREFARLAGTKMDLGGADFTEHVELLAPDGEPLQPEQWPMTRVLRGETVVNQELRLRRKNSAVEYWVLANALPLQSPEFRIIVNFIDITERKEALRALEESQLRLSALTSTVPEILFTATPEGHTDYQNERFAAYTGTERGRLLGEGWRNFMHPDDLDRVSAAWAASVATGSEYAINYRLRRQDGVYRWFQCRAVPIRDSNGNIVRWFGVCADIDDHKRLEEELAERSEELQRSNEDLQRFAYAASHDLQEPLRMVGSFTQLLTRKHQDTFDEQSKMFVRHILNGVDRMRELIHDLLEYSRVSHTPEGELPSTDANAVLGQALHNLQFKISECRARITFDPLPVVRASAPRLVQVFQNLIGNAITYCDTRPEVHIAAHRQDGEWVFLVNDNGIGIAPEYQDRIFGLFQRLHTRDEYPGTGIGLAITRRIIEQHGGRIWLDSAPGRGSRFYFTLLAG